MRIHRPAGLAAVLTIAAISVAACGGAAATPTAANPDGGTPAPTVAEGTQTPASQAPVIDASMPALAIPSFDLSQLGGGAIPGVDSYRVSMSTDGTKQYESVVVTKPEVAKHITTFKDDGSTDSEYILSGKKAWQSDGSGGWQEIPDTMASALLLAFDPAMLFGAYANLDWAGAAGDKGVETKNGIQARHFSIDAGSVLGAQMPPGTSVDMWAAEAGYLVALEIKSDSGGLDLQVSNVNDPANVVETP